MRKIAEKIKNRKGHTLAELLVAVGILAILLGIGMVAVIRYQKNLKLMEMDNTAKEIFIAAQNHVTALKASGEWDAIAKGKPGDAMSERPSDYPGGASAWDEEMEKDEHAFYTLRNNKMEPAGNSILAAILPYGAIDEHVRTEGSYIIEYDYKTASVYGVFYTDKEVLTQVDFEQRDSLRVKEERKKYRILIGYYGGATAQELEPVTLETPKVKIFNEETLKVQITDENYFNNDNMPDTLDTNEKYYQTKLTVVVEGVESKKTQEFVLELNDDIDTPTKKDGGNNEWWKLEAIKTPGKLVYTLTLDDITKVKSHFADICSDLIPGENIIIHAKLTSNKVLCNTVEGKETTNSLFAARDNKSEATVNISHIRHLLNLNQNVSGLPVDEANSGGVAYAERSWVKTALQTENIDWNAEKNWIFEYVEETDRIFNSETKIYCYGDVTGSENPGKAYSIFNGRLNEYHGNKQSISNFSMIPNASGNRSGNAGLFSQIGIRNSDEPGIEFKVDNLTLIDMTAAAVTYTVGADTRIGNAGILVGEVAEESSIEVKNVIVKNATVKSEEGSAGGLIGELKKGKVSKSAVYLSADNPGEKSDAKYKEGAFGKDKDWDNVAKNKYNIYTGDEGTAGGLVGNAGELTVENSFASLPVLAEKGSAGGLIGCGKNLTVKNSYSGGFTQDTQKGGKYSEDYYNVVQQTGNEDTSVGGLVGLLTEKGKIENSYSSCYVYGKVAGGLVGKDQQPAGESPYKNCYAIGKVENIEASNTETNFAGAFVGVLKNEPQSTPDCYFLSGVNGSMLAVGQGTASQIMKKKAGALASAPFEGDYAPENAEPGKVHETYCYDSKLKNDNKPYPYPTVNHTVKLDGGSTGVHYGDWPEVEEASEAEMVYYEIFQIPGTNQLAIGFYNKSEEQNQPEEPNDFLGLDTLATSDVKIVQDGYALLVTDEGEYKVGGISCYSIGDLLNVYENRTIQISRNLPTADSDDGLYGTDQNQSLTETSMIKLKKEGYEDKSFYLQFLDLSTVNALSDKNFYSTIEVKRANTSGGDSEGSFPFLYNPHYAKSVIKKGVEGQGFPDMDLPAKVSIRTERQYSMFTQDLNIDKGLFKTYKSLMFVQENDLNFGSDTAYTQWYFEKNTDESVVKDGVASRLPVCAAAGDRGESVSGFSGTYDGKGHKISNLSLSGEKDKTAGMFGNTQGATVQNLSLVNIKVTAPESQGVGAVAGCAGYLVDSASSFHKVNVTINSIQGDSYVGGMIGAGYGCTVNGDGSETSSLSKAEFMVPQDGIGVIAGNSLVGGALGYFENSKEASISNITLDDLHVSEKSHTSDEQYGTGGFVGKINILHQKQVLCSNIVMQNSYEIIIGKNTENSNKIAGAIWVGSLNYAQTSQTGNNELLTFEGCQIKGATLKVSAIGDNSYFGGLYGRVSGLDNSCTVTLDNQFSKEKESYIQYVGGASPAGLGKNTCGGLVGQLASISLKFKGSYASYTIPTMTLFTAKATTQALGGVVGSMDKAVFADTALEKVKIPAGVSGVYFGGFVGLAKKNSVLRNIEFTGMERVGSYGAELKMDTTGQQGSFGVLLGNADNSALENVTTNLAVLMNLSKMTAKNFGLIVGSSNNSVLTQLSISGKNRDDAPGTIEVQNNSQNVGGVAGYANACTCTEVSVTDITFVGNQTINSSSNESNIGGVFGSTVNYSQNNRISAWNVTIDGNGYNNTGGVIGRSETDTNKNISAEKINIKGSSINKGGMIGKLVKGSISEIKVTNIDVNGQGNNIGGAIGYFNVGSTVGDISISDVKIGLGEGGVSSYSDDGYVGGAIGHANGGSISAFTVSGLNIKPGTGIKSVGGIIGYTGISNTARGTYSSLQLNANDVHLTGSEAGQYIGGIVGQVSAGTFSSCTVNGNLVINGAEAEACGGIVGKVNTGAFSSCVISGDLVINGNGAEASGGIAGIIENGSFKNVKISEAAAGVEAVQPAHSIKITGSNYAGGFSGKIAATSASLFSGCLVQNLDITADDSTIGTGGFAGYLSGNLSEVSVQDVVVQGGQNVGGLVGEAKFAGISNCDVRLPSIANNGASETVDYYRVSSTKEGSNVGGLVGGGVNSNISQSFAAIPVFANGAGANVGGAAGSLDASRVEFSYASYDVANSANGSGNTGGFLGFAQNGTRISNSYATGDVQFGSSLGGFLGSADAGVIYMNNCYSLGKVLVSDNPKGIDYGGFVGTADTISWVEDPVATDKAVLFYRLLNEDLYKGYTGAEDNSEEKKMYETCLLGLIKRVDLNATGVNDKTIAQLSEKIKKADITIMNYILNSGDKAVDSGAHSNIASTSIEPAVTTVIDTLMKKEGYAGISAELKTWRLQKSSEGKLKLIYSQEDWNSKYYSGENLEGQIVPAYQFIWDGKDENSYSFETVNAVLNNDGNSKYKKEGETKVYLTINYNSEGTELNQKVTGCVFLKDPEYKYNDRKNDKANKWPDENNWPEFVSSKTYSKLTGTYNNTYVESLNTVISGGKETKTNRFGFSVGENQTHRYDKTLREMYPYPSISRNIGCEDMLNVHWGDWPQLGNYGLALVYYEKVKGDSTLYYRGYEFTPSGKYQLVKSDKDFVTEPGKYVQEEGYLILWPTEKKTLSSLWIMTSTSGYGAYSCTLSKSLNITLPEKLNKNYIACYLNIRQASPLVPKDPFIESEQKITFYTAFDGINRTILGDFVMTSHFADSVRETVQSGDTKEYKIRSAKQLINLAEKQQYANHADYLFTQNADISYSQEDVKCTVQGSPTKYDFKKPIAAMSAVYQSETYKDEITGNTCGYTINSLQAPMFDTIQKDTSIRGVTLTNLQSEGYGFVNENNGKIDSCSIRPKAASQNAYADVKITDADAGFVVANKGEIDNAYIVGTVISGEGKKAAGFCTTNTGIIQSSYVNCLMESKGSFSGFCNFAESGKIVNCHVLGKIEAGTGYGFVGSSTATIQNSYVALSQMNAKSSYRFGVNAAWGEDVSFKNCRYLQSTPLTGAPNEKSEIGTPATHAELASAVEKESKAEAETTHKFGMLNWEPSLVYPFELPYEQDAEEGKPYLTMQHWGDWPEQPGIDAALVYYEKMKDDSNLYYRGYTCNGEPISTEDLSGTENGLVSGNGKSVEESGYLLLYNKKWTDGNLAVKIGDNVVESSACFEQATDLKAEGFEEVWKLTKTENFSESGLSSVQIRQENYKDGQEGAAKVFFMTPYFGDSLQMENSQAENRFYIRSGEHLQNLASKEDFAKSASYIFEQQLDIDASVFTAPIAEFSGKYLVDTYVNAGDDNVYGFVLNGMKSAGMFGTVGEKAIIDGVTLTDLNTAEGTNGQNYGGFVTTNNGTIANCGIRAKIANDKGYNSVKIGNGTVNVAGFVFENKGTIYNSYITGTVKGKEYAAGFVSTNTGVIECSYANSVIKAKNFTYGFCSKNERGGRIENSHALILEGALFMEPLQTAYGFVGNNLGNLEACYTAMDNVASEKLNTFGEGCVESKNCFYLPCNWYGVWNGTTESREIIETGDEITYNELSENVDENSKATEKTTKKYGQYEKVEKPIGATYPFPLPSILSGDATPQITMQHYGDWPIGVSGKSLLEAPQESVEEADPPQQGTDNPAGIAYYETDGSYAGWYAVYSSAGASNADSPYDTLAAEGTQPSGTLERSLGILAVPGSVPECSEGLAEQAAASVTIDGVDFEYYPFADSSRVLQNKEVTLTDSSTGTMLRFTIGEDFISLLGDQKTEVESQETPPGGNLAETQDEIVGSRDGQ